MFTRTRSVLRSTDLIIAAVAIIAVLLAGCTSDDSTPDEPATTTSVVESGSATTANQDVVFGRGELPSTVPADFPIPEQAVVGATLVDTSRGLTEVILTYPADVPAIVEFYETNLQAFGYALDESTGTDANWTIDFSKDGLTGTITVSTAGPGLAQGSLRIVTAPAG